MRTFGGKLEPSHRPLRDFVQFRPRHRDICSRILSKSKKRDLEGTELISRYSVYKVSPIHGEPFGDLGVGTAGKEDLRVNPSTLREQIKIYHVLLAATSIHAILFCAF